MITEAQILAPGVKLITFSVERLDFYIGEPLKKEIMQHISADDKLVIFDFQAVLFMDSTGLGVLVFTLQHLIQTGAAMAFISLSSGLKELMTISRLDNFIKLFDDLSQAKSHFQIIQ